MGTLIPQTKYDVLPPGTYRVRLGALAVEDGIYGKQVVMRFDVLDEEFAGRCIKAWAAAKLTGGRRPSKLYSWTSALLFGGMPLPRRPPFGFGSGLCGAPPGCAFQRGRRCGGLPDDYDLDTDALRKREALAMVEIVERDGVLYNRIAQLFPLRAARANPSPNPQTSCRSSDGIPEESRVAVPPYEEGWVDDSDNGRILEEEPPW
jgi:hypothetical protein